MTDPMTAIGPETARHVQRMLGLEESGAWDLRTAAAFTDWAKGLGQPVTESFEPQEGVIEPEPKPDWQSGTVIFLVVGLIAQAAKCLWPEIQVDTAGLATDISDSLTVLAMLGAWWRRRVATAPLRIRRAG